MLADLDQYDDWAREFKGWAMMGGLEDLLTNEPTAGDAAQRLADRLLV